MAFSILTGAFLRGAFQFGEEVMPSNELEGADGMNEDGFRKRKNRPPANRRTAFGPNLKERVPL